VPHVNQPAKMRLLGAPPDDDAAACRELQRGLGSWAAERVATLEGSYTASEIKWLIGRCGFFVGARMHACIAAVSQGIPTVVQAYSKKAEGVMRLAGAGETVVDLRDRSLEESLAETIERFENRDALRAKLDEAMPTAKRRVEGFFRDRLAPQVARSLSIAGRKAD
jgi:colanic acid/amylovoran biosynthesis protein